MTTCTCLVITCSRCGQVNDDFETVHASTMNEVLDWFADWQWSDHITPEYCPGCVAELDCERGGHQWGPWQPSALPHRTHRLYRICEHCRAAIETKPTHPDTLAG
ncbi:hypothetical protein [Nonomuraea typhae]|uniref:hypothetical protein n=1 Tax=Nonomuraea typhae TaxID=2603600 RepID=UPI0012FAE7BC|nr:hypothetical protein [Nonomuraea typhae]